MGGTSIGASKGWTEERKAKHRASFNPYLGGGRPKGSKNKRPYPTEARQAKSIQTKNHWQTHDHNWTGKQHSEDTKEKQSDARNRYFENGGKVVAAAQGRYTPNHPEKYDGDANNIVYRSGWEKKFFRYCDDNSSILRWSSEEFFVPYISPVDGRLHRYFPDVWMEVKTTTGVKHFVVEIKPKAQSVMPNPRRRTQRYLKEVAVVAVNHAKWESAKEFCRAKGWEFLVLTEDHLFAKFKK